MKFTLKAPLFFLLILFVSLCMSEIGFSQKIHKDTINGEQFYVYPFRSDLNYHSAYFKGMKRTGGGRTSTKSWFIAMNGGVFDRAMYKEYKRYMRGGDFGGEFKEEHYLKSAKFKKAIRKNPYPLLEKRYTLDNDVVPSLDRIPDGRYVQYFDTFALILENGKTKMVGDKVSGIFSLKNNMLEGEAFWLSMDGDTLKKGFFSKGLKEGEWYIQSRRTEYSLSKSNVKQYINLGYPEMDTTTEYVFYRNGLMNGSYKNYQNSAFPIIEGQHKDNEEVGVWLEREVRYSGFGNKRKRVRNNDVVTFRYNPEKSKKVVHRPMIRFKFIEDYDLEEFDFESKYAPNMNFGTLFSIAFPSDENEIELEEEAVNTYEGAEMEYGEEGEEMYEDDYMYGDSYVRQKYDYKSGTYLTYPKLIDSLGLTFNYSGVFEKFYPNGQLMLRYEFNDGDLVSEDTVFWDNGKPYDVINYYADSNQYIQTIYDYAGSRFKEIVFDSIGEFIRLNYQPETVKYVNIDGFIAEDRLYGGKYFFYDKLDTMQNVLTDSLVIFRSWFKEDTSLLYSRSYNPMERKLDFGLISTMGNPVLQSELTFAEDFGSWTGWKNYYAGDLRLGTISSASFSTFYPRDSFPQNHVNDYDESFQVTEDYTLYRKEIPFSGKVDLSFSEKKYEIHVSDKQLKMSFSSAYSRSKKIRKDILRYRKSGKTRFPELLSVIDASEADEEYCNGIYVNLFSGVYDFIQYPYNEYDDYGRRNRRNMYPSAKKVKGYFLAGKPNGLWQVYDQRGKLMTEIPYENGEVSGTVRNYEYAYPGQDDYMYMEQEIGDTMPKKKTYYLQSQVEYKNGIRQGKSVQYNWLGEVLQEENYLDGFANGRAFERNKLAHTELNYEQGSLDGYVRTYLTLPKRDSILLFDLNFQNGALQGESRSYHINGKVAKKGFFLNGDPIDDYEAFDTLGIKFHYVKFQYSYPVEEKIWEENQLSVRYKFDWKDSIEFVPSDITSTQSLDEILYGLGIGTEYLDQPYYGRPSLINKEGINYHMTKYYPNDTIARDGELSKGKKVGLWQFFSYDGEKLYEVDYKDTIITINDSIQFKSKGILTDFNAAGQKLSESYVIEKFEKYDCSHTDHYEIRQLMTIWQSSDTLHRMNGYAKNYYDNGVLQNEGMMKDGLPSGVWKFYDPYGKLNQVGEYVLGKRNGRWLGGDLSKTKYLGEICLNPNLPDLEEEIRYREKLLDIVITNYRMGKALNKEFYDVNLNNYADEEGNEEMEVDIPEEIEER